jgi:BNR repeat-containing family member
VRRIASLAGTSLLTALVLLVPGCGDDAQDADLVTIVPDGAWTWFNDPRAVFHNDTLYVAYVRNSDGQASLSAFDPHTRAATYLWGTTYPERDDHDVPGLLVKQDGTMLAIHARHRTDAFFMYRLSTSATPTSPADWGPELTYTPATGSTVTYSNPYQLSEEGGLIYNFMRNINFNPTVTTSSDGGATWSPPRLLIQRGSSASQVDYNNSVYVKYASDYRGRIDFLYTDSHPRNLRNSLYHAYYQAGAIHKSDGAMLKGFADLPLRHDSGERGSVIYQYSDAPQSDPNEWIPTGRAWCSEIVTPSEGQPACVFTVQVDDVTGASDGTPANFSNDRIYYYYARWTGSAWHKRFIAHAGRPLYVSEDDYAGGICLDPEDPNVVYLSSSAAEPFDLSLTSSALRAQTRYELYRGLTLDGGLTFTWTPVTRNSTVDNLRPYIARHHRGNPAVLWLRGTYNTAQIYSTAIVGLF